MNAQADVFSGLSMRTSGYGFRQLGGSSYAGRVKVPNCLQHWMQ
jgi:hypothetical protein